MALGLGLLAYSLHGLWQQYAATHLAQPRPITATRPVSLSTTKPDEAPIAMTDPYPVAANLPRQITIPTIGADGFIEPVAVNQHHALGVPGNLHLAGWYNGSAKPGDPGLSLIDGHVQGEYLPGIFSHLSRLKPGDKLYIEFGDHSLRSFAVVSVQTYPAATAGGPMLAHQPGLDQQLNLITCGGEINPQTHTFDSRVLVVSRRI